MTVYDFKADDIMGQEVELADYKNTVLMIVNTASECGLTPQFEDLEELYQEYKDQGFEIFGVSLDKTRESWVKAIEADGITWPQVSELNYWDCSARDLYGFNSIPHNVLIDPDGIIIAKNLRGEELSEKLAELFE